MQHYPRSLAILNSHSEDAELDPLNRDIMDILPGQKVAKGPLKKPPTVYTIYKQRQLFDRSSSASTQRVKNDVEKE